MKKQFFLIGVFCILFSKSMHAQTTGSIFSVETDAVSGKKVLFYNRSLFLGNKDAAEKLSKNHFISSTKDNVFVLKVEDGGRVTKSVFLRKNYKWFFVTGDITDNFVVDIEENGVAIVLTITYDNKNTEEYHF